jgi:competence protein ComGC
MGLIKDLFGFLKERKKFWLVPAIIILLLISLIIVLTTGSAIAPFIYTIF